MSIVYMSRCAQHIEVHYVMLYLGRVSSLAHTIILLLLYVGCELQDNVIRLIAQRHRYNIHARVYTRINIMYRYVRSTFGVGKYDIRV